MKIIVENKNDIRFTKEMEDEVKSILSADNDMKKVKVDVRVSDETHSSFTLDFEEGPLHIGSIHIDARIEIIPEKGVIEVEADIPLKLRIIPGLTAGIKESLTEILSELDDVTVVED